MLNPCHGDGAVNGPLSAPLSQQGTADSQNSIRSSGVLVCRAPRLYASLETQAVVCCFGSCEHPDVHTAGAVRPRLPTSHAGHQTPFPLNFHRKSFLPGGAVTRHDLALRGGSRLVKLAVPGWCPTEGHGVSAREGMQLFENIGWAPCMAFVTGDTAHGGAPPRDGYVSVLTISVFLTPIKNPI